MFGQGEGASYVPYWRHIENHVAAHAVYLEPSPENPDGNEQDVLEDFHAQVKCLRGSTQCTTSAQWIAEIQGCREEKSLKAS